jgi:hypothetical protein
VPTAKKSIPEAFNHESNESHESDPSPIRAIRPIRGSPPAHHTTRPPAAIRVICGKKNLASLATSVAKSPGRKFSLKSATPSAKTSDVQIDTFDAVSD